MYRYILRRTTSAFYRLGFCYALVSRTYLSKIVENKRRQCFSIPRFMNEDFHRWVAEKSWPDGVCESVCLSVQAFPGIAPEWSVRSEPTRHSWTSRNAGMFRLRQTFPTKKTACQSDVLFRRYDEISGTENTIVCLFIDMQGRCWQDYALKI